MIGGKKDEAESDHRTELSESKSKSVFGFRAVHVFDISQTEGDELPKLSEIRGSAEHNLLFLESVFSTLNIKLETRPMPEGIRGASLGGHVIVKEGLDKSMRFRVLAHELSHEILHPHMVMIETIRKTQSDRNRSRGRGVCCLQGLWR
jgi:hypothetical protein